MNTTKENTIYYIVYLLILTVIGFVLYRKIKQNDNEIQNRNNRINRKLDDMILEAKARNFVLSNHLKKMKNNPPPSKTIDVGYLQLLN